jgi:ParB-like chromosome segregation protein Spo0J
MSDIERRKIAGLRPHPENARLFDTPDESTDYEGIRDSIKKHGLWEPIVIKEDGTILSGHLRTAAMRELGHDDIPCRVMAFDNYRAEVTFLVRSNTDRRQLSKAQMARAFELLKRLPAEQGGAKQKRGGTRSKFERESGSEASASGHLRTDEAAASELGIGRHEAEALSTVFVAPPASNDDTTPLPL